MTAQYRCPTRTSWQPSVVAIVMRCGPTAVLWAAFVWIQRPASGNELLALMTMFAGLVGLSLGAAGVAARQLGAGRGGIAVGPALLALLMLSTTFPPRLRPLPLGDIPGGWAAIETRWTSAAIIGIVVCICSSRGGASRGFELHERKHRGRTDVNK